MAERLRMTGEAVGAHTLRHRPDERRPASLRLPPALPSSGYASPSAPPALGPARPAVPPRGMAVGPFAAGGRLAGRARSARAAQARHRAPGGEAAALGGAVRVRG